jgi:hypothetical protein
MEKKRICKVRKRKNKQRRTMMLNSNRNLLTRNKEHKFFERNLDIDLVELSKFLEEKYLLIENATLPGVTSMENDQGIFIESGSLSTVKWKEYNVFQFYHASLHKLYRAISDTVKEACEYYDVDFNKQNYYIQGWFNINRAEVGKLDYHDHGSPGAPNFHGYYCVNAEPSVTHYKLFNDPSRIVDNVNKNNRLVVSEVGHPHAMGDWDWSGPRITIAYDVQPLNVLLAAGKTIPEQHWFPLL